MKNKQDLKAAFFIGIGGIGMSAIARYMISLGIKVFGFDKTKSMLTTQLESEGIQIVYEDAITLIDSGFLKLEKDAVLVVYTPAIAASNYLLQFFQQHNYPLVKRAEALGKITQGSHLLAVAGTHGKTTTSCLIAHLFKNAKRDCAAFLGGISTNYNTNFLQASHPQNAPVVAEADEFDRSFLSLFPGMAVLTSMDADHLDIYGDHETLLESFQAFCDNIKENGYLILKYGLPILLYQKNYKAITYGFDSKANVFAANLKIHDHKYFFDYHFDNMAWTELELGMPGKHNVENALAAITVARLGGLSESEIRSGLKSFSGVKRRFEYIINTREHVFIDDYAHHPEELKAFILSVKEMYPDKRIFGIFQPHLFTRTRDFADAFAESLSLLDTCRLLPIYPAREEPIAGVNSEMILNKIKQEDKKVSDKATLLAEIAHVKPELLLSIGAGDIDNLIPELKEKLC